MTEPQWTPRTDVLASTLARNRLGVLAVLFFVLSAAAPLTVVAGVVTTGYAVTETTSIPIAFLAVGLVLAVFAVGYVSMARHLENAGAFYAYVARGLGRPIGVGAALVALLAYNALQTGLYGAIGPATGPLLQRLLGWDLAWWLIALAAWLLVAVLGVLRVDVNGRVLAVLLLTEVAAIVVVDVVAISHPAGGTVSYATLNPGGLLSPAAGAVLSLALLGFVGFESAVVYAEESRDPHRTVRLATYLSVAVIGLLYAGSAWALSVASGPDRIVADAQEQQTELLFNLTAAHLGTVASDVVRVLFTTSLVAAMISFHNSTARYAFALGRERVLPGRLGTTSARTHSPVVGSILQSAIGLAVIVGYAAAGWDPLVHLFYLLGTSGGYGILLLLAATSIAVLIHGIRYRRAESPWRRFIAPTIAMLALLIMAGWVSWELPNLLGVPADSPIRVGVHFSYFAVAILGVGWGLILKVTRPEVYQRIGYGAKAAVVSPSFTATGPSNQWIDEPTGRQETIR